MRRTIIAAAALALAGALVASVGAGTQMAAKRSAGTATAAACKAGSVPAVVGGKHVCLRAGVKCKARYEPIYKRKGFHCANGRLRKASAKPAVKPAISIADASGKEGNSGTSSFAFTVSLSAATSKVVSVQYATADGTAAAPGDYGSANGTLTFSPGQTSKTINVSVVGDTTYEQDETFTVTLSNAANATIANGSATGTIQNDDTIAMPGDYVGKTSQNELFKFTVTSDGASLTGLKTGQVNESCNPDLINLFGGNLDLGQTFPINADGTFSFVITLSGTIGGSPLTAVITITGTFTGNTASGTFLEVDTFNLEGTNFTCTSNPQTWTATHA